MKILEINSAIFIVKYSVQCAANILGYAKEFLNLNMQTFKQSKLSKRKVINEENR